MTLSLLKRDFKSLAGSSVIYGISSVLLRGLSFVLLPLYTRYLTTADYGITGAIASVVAVLSIVLPFGLHGAITRYWFAAATPEEQREHCGTIFVTLLILGLAVTLLADGFSRPIFFYLFPDIAFHPYIRMAIWTAFFNMIGIVPLLLYQVRQRPLAYVTLTVVNTLLSIALIIYFVVVRREGAYGYLLGLLIASALFVIPYIIIGLRYVSFVIRPAIAFAALSFSLPLVPHGLASWVLDLSDRALLAHYVSLADLGIYSVGYQLGATMGLVVGAFTNAWAPFLYKTIAQQGSAADGRLSKLVTYYGVCLAFLGLGVALFAKAALVALTPAPFHRAHLITPWVSAGYVFNGLYIVPMGFLFWKERTKVIPFVTIGAGGVNVLLNVLLIPRFGVVTAAVVTCVSYALMLIFAWMAAQRAYPFPYEYRRLGTCLIAASCMLLVAAAAPPLAFVWELAARIALWLAFPFLLLALRVFSGDELRMARVFSQSVLRRIAGHAG